MPPACRIAVHLAMVTALRDRLSPRLWGGVCLLKTKAKFLESDLGRWQKQ